MADNSLNISIPLKFEMKTPPRGMTDYDTNTLSPDEQRELNIQKLNIRKENIIYLAEHPEVRALLSLILRRTLAQRPRDTTEFIAKFFTRPQHIIEKEVEEIINESEIEYNSIPYSKHENWDY